MILSVKNFFVVCIILVLTLSGCNYWVSDHKDSSVPEIVDYNLHVRGILSANCFACHGPDANSRAAGLRLDTSEGAFAPLDSDLSLFAIVPGSPNSSEVYRRISSKDPARIMPPTESHLTLSDYEIAVIKKWIEQGAEYKKHWAFIPPVKPALPEVSNPNWPLNNIDIFTLAGMDANQLMPAKPAEKERLIRRISFDLTGLPPSISELDEFMRDTTANAYEKLVDRLLASPAFGERMASEWLDVARYADSHGFQDDIPNNMWPWRDWVVDSFNQNMPFNQFGTWQIAGDLIPEATRDQILATGFNRLHQQTPASGSIDEEYRFEYAADRVMTTGTAFLGLTLQCARCHDHKFDPISQKEYYQLMAFFDKNNDTGQIPYDQSTGPAILLPDDKKDELIRHLNNEIKKIEQQIQSNRVNRQPHGFEKWIDKIKSPEIFIPNNQGLLLHYTFDDIKAGNYLVSNVGDFLVGTIHGNPQIVKGRKNDALEFTWGNYINVGTQAQFHITDSFTFSFWVNTKRKINDAPLVSNRLGLDSGGRGYEVSIKDQKLQIELVHGWPHNAIILKSSDHIPVNEWSHIAITYNGAGNANGIRIFINGIESRKEVIEDHLYKNIYFSTQNTFIANRRSQVQLKYKSLAIDEIKIFERELSKLEILFLAENNSIEYYDEFDNTVKDLLLDYFYQTIDSLVLKNKSDLKKIRERKYSLFDQIPEVMVMREKKVPEPTMIRKHGAYNDPGKIVHPGTPKSIFEFDSGFEANRLGLAEWIFHDRNPLTARVIVNRYWQMIFGAGLVTSPDDFGAHGDMPTHPELLDWLAVSFIESEWNTKKIIKKMVMSATYRQASVQNHRIVQLDPDNEWLSRAPSKRLTAEMVRDQALVVSGLIVPDIGGPPVFPYQPEGIWEEHLSGRVMPKYEESTGQALYRRSLYTFTRRTIPPPGMSYFDASIRTHPTVKRQVTNTPMQALYLLNDPIYIESSLKVAERMIKEGGYFLRDQIEFMYKTILSRAPDPFEIEVLEELYQKEYCRLASRTDKVKQILGLVELSDDEISYSIELASKAMIAHTVLNLHEAIYVN